MIEAIKNLDYNGIIAEYVIHNIADIGIKNLNKFFNTKSKILEEAKFKDFDLSFSEEIILNNIIHNLKKTSNWCNEISFKQAIKSKELQELFIELDLYVAQLRSRTDIDEKLNKISSKKLLNSLDKNILVFGGPGAGKTTLLKSLCNQILTKRLICKDFTCILLIKFREINFNHRKSDQGYDYTLFDLLLDELGIIINFPKLKDNESSHHRLIKDYYHTTKRSICEFIDNSRILLIFDGFDELPTNEIKRKFERDFIDLALALNKSRFIITSRNGDFNAHLSNTNSYEISPLDDTQIKEFIHNWIKDKEKSQKLYSEILKSPYYDTSLRPLTLAHLCAIYERRKLVPTKPRHIYGFVIELLIENWDEQRGIIRPSKYANFYIEKKKEFLANLAFWLTIELDKIEFSTSELKKCYNQIKDKHNLSASQANKVISEIESHSGLITQIGHESYQFSHKSLQEYLSAKYILALPIIPNNHLLNQIPNELAIAVSLSTDPNLYFVHFSKNKKGLESLFWINFITRLAIEKPDFDKTPEPLVLLFDVCYKIHKGYSALLIEAISSLIQNSNINNCFKQFNKIYKTAFDFENEVIFEHIDKDCSLPERNYMPLQLKVDKVLLENF